MKKLLILFLAVTTISVTQVSCMANPFKGVKGNGNVVTQNRPVTDFNKINVCCGMNVTITQGENIAVVVETDENLQDLVITEVSNGELVIRRSGSGNFRPTKLNIQVTAKTMEALDCSSGSNVKVPAAFNTPKLNFDASSGCNVEVVLAAQLLEADISSGCNISFSGSAKTLSIDASSGSNFYADSLECDYVKANGSSGANVHVRALLELEAHASSGANIGYNGLPKNVTIDKSSGGNVFRK